MCNGLGAGKTAIVFHAFDSSTHLEAIYCRLPSVASIPLLSDIPLLMCSCISILHHCNESYINSSVNAILVGVLLLLYFCYPILFHKTRVMSDHGSCCFYLIKCGNRNEGFHDEQANGKTCKA